MIGQRFPVIGESIPWFAEIQNPFDAFDTGTVHGLAFVRQRRIDILAVHSHLPGQGDFRRFIEALKGAYDTIGIWEIINADMHIIMPRLGFTAAQDILGGDPLDGYRWEKS